MRNYTQVFVERHCFIFCATLWMACTGQSRSPAILPSNPMIKLLIGDDHAVVREGLKRIISEAGDMQVVGEAATGQEVIEKLRARQVDLVLLDLSFGERSGFETLMQIKRESSRVPVLVVSMHPEEMVAIRVLKAGAQGYLRKDSPPDMLVSVIRKVASGGRYVSPVLADTLVAGLKPGRHTQPHDRLSDREYEILCLIASGRSLPAIANLLSISVKTVGTYRTRILEKLGLKTTAQLIHYGVCNGLTRSDEMSRSG
jgi:two-component system invasion response regulator UvrY